ncbi:PIN domain-containing protein [Candidatus Woesearchaeota archaeon]|nr:PIN domain-containing protein [Candidatus Woesearchaeota archaeon]
MILDTDFIIDVMNKDEAAMLKQQKMFADDEIYRVSAPTIFELWTGIALSGKSEAELVKVIKTIAAFDTIKMTRESAEKAGEIHGSLIKNGQEIDAVDSMIAGAALLENETVLTRNTKHFTRVTGLRVESY